ncbi:purine-cytosine permease FCY21 [Cordyceps fumosorosea ARSEF 2679]|uniref:Purine-cytosine permease FCY21 n=1 Tax=Cordyceps fumosorosea (strain ARSEF 2679) TaxID=1081104 RepID=A0A168EEA2_CORFA|nr:purine-cytosine permease FCY21 [Cordyceps fumosorosea ARSEF 2679]OAA73711.1 purine-cytosine permease FCY21 [Cordyceps fumosorosea ARSEF 2679]
MGKNQDTKPEEAQHHAGAARPVTDEEQGDSRRSSISSLPSTFQKILRYGRVEARGIEPIPLEERTSTRYYNIATIWTSINTNIIGITFGMLGPLAYNLRLRDAALVILFFNIISCVIPGYLSTLGPKTGLRQMIQARYSFGRYLVSIPVLLNLATMTGFTVIIFITGGQCLTAVSNGTISPNAGIIIIGIISLVVSFCGFRVLHIYETYAFVVAVIAITITAGCGGAGLAKQSVPAQPATAANVLNFGMIVASYQIPYAGLASDMSAYFNPKVSTWRVFWYTYLGLMTPTILLMTLGAAIAGAIPNNPAWQDQYDKYLVGGALSGLLAPAGGFGKFVLVILALTLLGNTCGTFYSITLNFQTLLPWLFRVPRYVFALVITVIIVVVSIFAVDNFFVSIENAVSLIGYWSSQFCAVVIVEDVVFRRRDPAAYDHAAWCDARRLPLGVAAMGAGVLAWGLIVPAMNQVYFTGPIAKHTGDIGFELAFFCSGLLYIPLRYAEKRLSGR